MNDRIIRKGRIYIARSNNHLLLQKEFIKLGHGPEENRWRPSIDVIESTRSISLRIIEERKMLLLKMAGDSERRGHLHMGTENREKANTLETHINQLKSLLYYTQNSD